MRKYNVKQESFRVVPVASQLAVDWAGRDLDYIRKRWFSSRLKVMKLKTLAEYIGCRVENPADVDVTGVEYDSRRVAPSGRAGAGVLFAAVPGEKTDGQLYIKGAVNKGAACVLASRVEPGVAVPQLIVDDVRAAVAAISDLVYGEPSKGLRTIGVTGTNGKTTVTYLLESILNHRGGRTGVVGTVNYRYGGCAYPAPHTTPEAPDLSRLLKEMVDAGVNCCVMEVSSHALSQKRVEGMSFDAAIFTNLTHEHLDYHRTMEEYFEAKSILFKRLLKYPEAGRAIVNIDDLWGAKLASELGRPDVVTYSLRDGADVYPVSFELTASGTKALVAVRRSTVRISSRLVGEYNLSNILAAVAAASTLGVSPEDISAGVAALDRVPGRLEPVESTGPRRFKAFVDYAHTGDALRRAIMAVRSVCEGRVITVFGCGGNRDRDKRPLMGEAAARLSDIAVVTSDNPRDEDPEKIIEDILAGMQGVEGARRCDDSAELAGAGRGYMVVADRGAAIREAIGMAADGDAVLVAGKGHEDYQIINGRRLHFDDMEVVREAIGAEGAL